MNQEQIKAPMIQETSLEKKKGEFLHIQDPEMAKQKKEEVKEAIQEKIEEIDDCQFGHIYCYQVDSCPYYNLSFRRNTRGKRKR